MNLNKKIMITLIEGQTGAGKTFLSVKLLYKAWKKGENIYSNHQLNFDNNDRIKRWHNLDELYSLKNGIIFIDDAVKLLDAHRWHSLPSSFKEKIAGHRHDNLDIITNIQDFYQINVDIRRNVHRLITVKSIFRSNNNDRKLPILQIIKATTFTRSADYQNEKSKWISISRPKYYFISKLFTRKLYHTFDNIYLNKFICKLEYEKKPNKKKGEWLGKIYSRELVNQGKARI